MASITSMPGNAIFVMESADCYVHKFDNRIRTQLSEGPCEIFESNTPDEAQHGEKLYYLRVNNFFHILRHSQVFVRINYTGSVCYLFENSDSELCCLSFNRGEEGLDKFEEKFGQMFTIVDFNSEMLDERLRERIRSNCPENLEKEDISYDAKRSVSRMSMSIGLFTGKVENFFQSPTAAEALGSLSDRANRFSQEYISENAKSKWNTIKETSSAVNDALTVIVKPVMKVLDNVTTSIGKSFHESENTVIKTIREYSLAVCDSLNEGQKKGREVRRGLGQREEVSAILLR